MIAAMPTTYRAANTKVVELVAEVKALGWSPEDLIFQLPHLTLGQVHSAERDSLRRSGSLHREAQMLC